MNPHHLPRLQSLHHENPTKRISLIRLAWPDIEKALARGHTLKLIHARLKEDGSGISYSLLSLYVRRLQGKGSAKKRERHQIQAIQPGLPVQAADCHAQNGETEQSKSPSATPNSNRNAPRGDAEERAFWYPDELMHANERDGHQEHCFFKERVPDINELFRVTKST